MTKPEEILKNTLYENIDTLKIEVNSQLIDNNLHLQTPLHVHLNTDDIIVQPKKRVAKNKMTTKTQLEKATSQLYNLEKYCTPEKILNIDLGLYQIEDY